MSLHYIVPLYAVHKHRRSLTRSPSSRGFLTRSCSLAIYTVDTFGGLFLYLPDHSAQLFADNGTSGRDVRINCGQHVIGNTKFGPSP